jgi:hypothetical protein
VDDGAAAGFSWEKIKTCGLALSSDNGRSWRSRTLVGMGGLMPVPSGFVACWNPSVSYGPDGILYYLFQASLSPSNPYSQVWIATSGDGGLSFDRPVAVDPHVPAYPGQRAGGDWWPSMAVGDPRGTVYVTWSRFTPVPDTSEIMVASSTDLGRSLSPPTRVSPPTQLDVTGSIAGIGRSGTLEVSWIDYTEWQGGDASACVQCLYPGYAALLQDFYSKNGSRLDYTQGLNCYEIQGGYPDGNNVAGGGCSAPARLWSATSTDGGVNFEVHSPAAAGVYLGCPVTEMSVVSEFSSRPCDTLYPSFYDHNVSSMTTGAQQGQLYLALWDTGTTQGNAASQGPGRLSLASSTDGGMTWHARAPVGVTIASDQQYRPSVSAAPDGRVDMVYYDLAAASGQGVYWVSLTGGRLSAPVELTSGRSSVAVGPQGDNGVTSFGDHLGVASSDRAVYTAWTDARPPATHQSIYFARLSIDPLGSSPATSAGWQWPLAVGLVAVVIVGSGLVAAGRRGKKPGRRRRVDRPRAPVHGRQET